MRDSDWDDDENPGLRTIYSESDNRINPSHSIRAEVDLKVSDWLGFPRRVDLRPVIGWRWQRLRFVTHDGVQSTIGETPLALPGDGIRFCQTYHQYFVGLKSDIDLTGYVPLPRFNLLMQADWAYVEGKNEDLHLLRAGQRYTFERTHGEAWHGFFCLKAGLTDKLALGLEIDWLQISTTGSHRLLNVPFEVDFTLDHGVTVWSRQTSLALVLEYAF